MLMGAAEVVPGVSGGTIAFISGIYERLLNSLRQFTPRLLGVLRRDGIKAVRDRVDGGFLLLLGAGMGFSVIAFAGIIGYFIEHEAIALWSFFAGLVLGSVYIVTRQISRFGLDLVMAAAAGVAVGVVITSVAPVEIEPTPWFIFAAGAVAVSAWILPGLSGSFILLILGLYTVIIDAINTFEVVTLLALASGCAIGLVTFAQVLWRLLSRFRDETLAVLTGFMLGSLVKLWPWKHTLSYQNGRRRYENSLHRGAGAARRLREPDGQRAGDSARRGRPSRRYAGCRRGQLVVDESQSVGRL
ncbi:MAG: DUF368 domain-containing protein [Gammaproteobacteria bacterium]|nr:DUF368 domain-containing protein [Gammaproteobacteria bacterium]